MTTRTFQSYYEDQQRGSMRLWPFYSMSFETSFAANEALRRLHEEIGRGQMWAIVGPINLTVGSNPERRMFLGCPLSDGGEFRNNLNSDPGELRKVNSFQAVIRARIEAAGPGSKVSVSLRLSGFVATFMALSCVLLASFTLAVVDASLHGEGPSPFLILAGPAFISLLWLVTCLAFSEDAETAERMLRVTLERD